MLVPSLVYIFFKVSDLLSTEARYLVISEHEVWNAKPYVSPKVGFF